MQTLSPDVLSEQLRNDDEGPLVLDIRHEAEFEKWHIPGSVNVDVYDELTGDPDRAKPALSALPRESRIVTVCAEGVVSQTATDVLRELGYDAVTLGEVRSRNADLALDREAFVEELASDVPDHPPNFERVKRTNVGRESVPADELAELELGPNNCAAE
ncbi:rhodanese-like domain-containing protein [Halorubrum kocurii]|uniref:Fused rhodanese domain-containing protein/hydrolase n=1 Tax=Halorubrum kocurii JCM 14978 TaxID=1230456 RepID=M0NVK7_9EURY|nr:rhodanese-like domain-containing protein [Halorubrum kocurii]EMA61846.1 fused rhodanese domain-containing protein/hydrolase [Halorubrum kocurii JCM 14978]